ncbi:MAG: cobalamin-dependent protein [Deltaproteobacteria bacterium]|jgi:methanogenic corrinoid protein MtbC1|nr:cobalamin-dependent protein [Deltaproteobacteria bacterium]
MESVKLSRLYDLIVDLKEVATLSEVANLLGAGVEPKAIMDCFYRALNEIGRLFQSKQYYMVALVLAGELMREALKLIMPRLTGRGQSRHREGLVIVATIEGDIHDLGKSLASFLLTTSGFEVVDLGVDVPPRIILTETMRLKPDAVGVSLLLTTCVPAVKRLSSLFEATYSDAPQRPLLFAGCGFNLPEQTAHSSPPQWLGVDAIVKDAYDTVLLCLERVASLKTSS